MRINANNALTHHTVNSVQQVFHYILSLWFNDNSLFINNDITRLKTVLNKLHEDKSELYRHLLFFALKIHFDANEKCRNALSQTNTICSSLNVVHDYTFVLEYLRNIYRNPNKRQTNKRNEIVHIWLHDGSVNKWYHPLSKMHRNVCIMHKHTTMHVACTMQQRTLYEQLQRIVQ